METKLKDVLHLYLGCEVQTNLREESEQGEPMKKLRGKFVDMDLLITDCCGIRLESETDRYNTISLPIKSVKPILRLISDIKLTEAFHVYKSYFGKETVSDYSGDNGSAYFNPKKRRVTTEDAINIVLGIDWETGDFLKVAKLIPYLTKQGFDLFGLIESSQAIDKTTLTS